MTLLEVTNTLLAIAKLQPNVRTALEGSVYQLDTIPDAEYDVFVITQTQHREDATTSYYGFNLFWISREDDTMKNNKLQLQSQGKEVLSNIIRTFCNRFDVDFPDNIEYHPFQNKFTDLCAGVYAGITLELPVEWICDEEYGSITEIDPSPAKPIQHKSIRITSNGHFTVFPDDDYYALSSVDITVDVESTGRTTYYDTLGRVYDYLYDATYSRLDYDYAYDYFEQRGPQPNIAACSSVRKGMNYGRNLDWLYSNEVDYIIRTQTTIGIAGGLTGLTKHIAETDPYDENYHILPFMMQDGVNRDGVFANINVVSIEDGTPTTHSIPLVSKELDLCGLMLVRYVLDHFHTAREAVEYIRDHVSLYFPTSLQEQNYECHYMIGDKQETYALEIIDNEVKIIDDQNVLTNFYLYDTTANTDGSFYSIIDVPTHDPMEENGLRKYSAGVERYNYALVGLRENQSIREIMNSLLYSKTYTKSIGYGFWYSEYVGGELGIGDGVSTYLEDGRIDRIKAQFEERDRENPITWHTTHSVVYNLSALTLDILSQETDSYQTSMDEHAGDYDEGYQDGYEDGYERGHESGFNEGEINQKSKLTTLEVTANGTYTRNNGWSAVTVNVPDPTGYTDIVLTGGVITVQDKGKYVIVYDGSSVVPTDVRFEERQPAPRSYITYMCTGATSEHFYLSFKDGSFLNDRNQELAIVTHRQDGGLRSIWFNDVVAKVHGSDRNTIFNDEDYKYLTYIAFPDTITEIGGLRSCSSLESVVIPNNCKTVLNTAFGYCSNLYDITLPTSLEKIEDFAFRECTRLQNFTISENVSYIGSGCFYGCTRLENLVCSPSIPPELDIMAFEGCTSLTSIKVLTREAVDVYKSAPRWRDYADIIEYWPRTDD